MGQCLQADRLHLGIEVFFFLKASQLISLRSLETRISCKFLGFLYPIVGVIPANILVAELLYRIGQSSSNHCFIGGSDGL